MGPQTVAIIGAGKVGSSMGCLLARAGYRVTAIASRSRESAVRAAAFIGSGEALPDPATAAALADIVLITTPDSAVRDVCARIAASGKLRPRALVIHTSGSQSIAALQDAKAAGALRAVLHPLQSLPNREQGVAMLPGSYYRIEADPDGIQSLRDILAALGGRELALPGWNGDEASVALYHAGAVAVSNYFVALVDYGLQFYQVLGADKNEALNAVLPLIKGTLSNIEKLGTTAALTGPIVRGDCETVKSHLAAMQKRAPELMPLYKKLARHTIAIARERNSISRQTADELVRLLH